MSSANEFQKNEKLEKILNGLRDSYEKSVMEAPASREFNLEKYLVFLNGEKKFALPIRYVREIFQTVKFTKVPNTSGNVLGIINLRGEIISVLSLHSYLNQKQPEPGSQQRLLITRNTPFTTGIISDGQERAFEAKKEDVETGNSEEFIKGLLKIREEEIPIIDLIEIMKKEAVE